MRLRQRENQSDRVLVGLKIGTFLAVAVLIGVIVLLVTANVDSQPVSRRSPAVPKITPSGSVAPTTTTTTTTTVDPPAVLTETTEVGAEPATPSDPPKPVPRQRQRPGFQFAVIGERCPQPGAFSFTRDHRPVTCARRTPAEQPRWQPVF